MVAEPAQGARVPLETDEDSRRATPSCTGWRRVYVYLDPAVRDALDVQTLARKRSRGELIRRACRAWLGLPEHAPLGRVRHYTARVGRPARSAAPTLYSGHYKEEVLVEPELLTALDGDAVARERSRSWVMQAAVRSWLGMPLPTTEIPASAPR